jgi:hypothetical protein
MKLHIKMAIQFFFSFVVAEAAHTQSVMAIPGQFSVGASGAANYAIPLMLPPGVAGVAPVVSLVYSSQGGNGQLGAGWGLAGLSSITRCPRTISQDGIARGIHYDLDDRYCLDGQRLIVVSGVYGASGTTYRTELESFSLIVSQGVAGNGPATFRVWSKSGQLTEYGNTEDSRIEAAGKPTVRVWVMNKVVDTKGNFFTVAYKEDNPSGSYYPIRIEYAGNANAGTVATNAVLLSYQTMSDASEIYLGDSILRSNARLNKIQTQTTGAVVSEYRLAYSNDTRAGHLNAITLCDGANVCLPATTFAWQAGAAAGGFGSQVEWGPLDTSTTWFLSKGDANGDGLTDLLVFDPNDGSIRISYSTGISMQPWVLVVPPSGGAPVTVFEVSLGDVDGDGRADIVSANGMVRLSSGNGFGPEVKWFSAAGLNPNFQPRLADMNGDGRADLLVLDAAAGRYKIAFSNGHSFDPFVDIGPVIYRDYVRLEKMSLGDVNGDGLADLVSTDGTVRLANGTGFDAPIAWGPAMPDPNWQISVGDLNADSYEDLLAVDPVNRNMFVAYSNGKTFSPWYSIGAVPASSNGLALDVVIGDFNGDGQADAITANGQVRLGMAPVSDLVVGITDGLGARTAIAYKPLTDASVYTPDTNAVYPLRDVLRQGPLYVVAQAQTPNGREGSVTMAYSYGGLKADMQGRGVLGFRWRQDLSVDTGMRSMSTFRQDWPYAGLPLITIKSLPGKGNGGLLKQVVHSYDCMDFVSASGCLVGIGRRYFPFVNRTVESGWDLDGTTFPVVRTDSQYDSFGNATNIAISSSDGYVKTTFNTFSNDTQTWKLGRLTSATATNTKP